MELFERHKVLTSENECTIILYLHPFATEFAGELGHEGKQKDLQESAKKYVQTRFPNIKYATIKVVSGLLLVSSFSFAKGEVKVSAHKANFNMTYLYFGNTSSYIKQIDRTNGNLNIVSPSFFDINPDGSLKLTSQISSSLVSEMHKRGIKVVPFLSNHWDRNIGRAALANREQLATQIANAISQFNLDGVQVDIENVTDVDQANYTDLVRLLREKLPANKEVSVAVAANPYGWNKGWHGSYNYKELAKHSSYLMIMAYDESFQGSPEGPVASYDFVEGSITYALGEGVPNEKIVLGIPFYGRYWKQGENYGGYGISNIRVAELKNNYKSTVTYDEQKQSPKLTFEIKSTDPKTTIAGRTLTEGTYYLWFEDERSIKAKIDLVHKYNLKGTGSWSLGQEDPAIWEDYKTWMLTHSNEIPNSEYSTGSGDSISGSESTYIVKAGDTLSGIAKAEGITVDQLKQYNSLTTDAIYIGQLLYLTPNKENITIQIPNTKLPTNHGQIIGRLTLKEDTPLVKRQSNGSFITYKMLKNGEVINVYGVLGNRYDVGGDYYIKQSSKMSLHVGRLLVKDREILYKPDGTVHRHLKKGEALRVYSYNHQRYDVGGGYFVKPTKNVSYYEGFIRPKTNLPLYNPNGRVHRMIQPTELIRVYGIDRDRFFVGGGYYVLIDKTKATFIRH
ncbi:MAG TPA: glycosyl hydrolase family 18 protein [Metabacillus sp.]|nr:glycosyl hydrolase family 18 protein [Metabacillus sp.]